jgi:uncharacterized protein (UPF0333 family)
MFSRGQVGFEYLTFTAFLLLVTGVLFAYSYISYSTTVQLVQTQAVVDDVASAVDFVYAKGPGNSVLVDIKLPAGLSEFRTDRNAVIITVQQPGGTSNIFSFTKVPITPQYLYFEEGLYTLRVTMEDENASVQNV